MCYRYSTVLPFFGIWTQPLNTVALNRKYPEIDRRFESYLKGGLSHKNVRGHLGKMLTLFFCGDQKKKSF